MARSGGNGLLHKAKKDKKDEFYTQYIDIQKEVIRYLDYNPNVFRDKVILLPCDDPEWSNFTKYFAQNFEKFGLKKLISTSYAPNSSKKTDYYQPSLFEVESPFFDEEKTITNGKIFVLERDVNGNNRVDIDDLEWKYLEGDGDFRSKEVTNLRNEADFIITNPPFSLFREFFAWCIEDRSKKYLIIGNNNCITYKEIFPEIMGNLAWLGHGMSRWISGFIVPKDYPLYGTEATVDEDGNRIVATNNCLWLTNIEHGKRHEPMSLMTMAENLKFSSHKDIRENGYQKYDNYDAIECPYTDAIPSDYEGVIGVPITFLDKYCPEQFKIVGCSYQYGKPYCHIDGRSYNVSINGTNVYKRLFIQKVSK